MNKHQNRINPSYGGRGIKAQYPTTTVRIPEALKASIQDIVYKFYQCDGNSSFNNDAKSKIDSDKKLEEIETYLNTFIGNNKVTKSKVKLYELVTGLQAILDSEA
ncbi:MAG: hypothetical protein NVSMB70_14790 [Chamaesiphon sp.]